MKLKDLLHALRWPTIALEDFLTEHKSELPEIWALKTLSETAGGEMHKNNFLHTIQVVRQCLDAGASDEVLLAALFHDIGKPPTRRIENGKVMFHMHEMVGNRLLRARFAALGWDVGNVPEIILNASRMQAYTHENTDSAVRRMALEVGDLWSESMVLARCDVTSKHQRIHNRVQESLDRLEAHKARVAEIDAKAAFRPVLNGHDLMAMGFTPGEELGEILHFLKEENLRGRLTTPEAARAALTAVFGCGKVEP